MRVFAKAFARSFLTLALVNACSFVGAGAGFEVLNARGAQTILPPEAATRLESRVKMLGKAWIEKDWVSVKALLGHAYVYPPYHTTTYSLSSQELVLNYMKSLQVTTLQVTGVTSDSSQTLKRDDQRQWWVRCSLDIDAGGVTLNRTQTLVAYLDAGVWCFSPLGYNGESLVDTKQAAQQAIEPERAQRRFVD